MAVRFSSQSGVFELSESERMSRWVTEVVRQREMSVGNINYLFCDDDYLIEVNRQYLHHDTYTDIITFDYVAGNLVSGDIMISTERVGENATKFGVPFEQELHRVIIHGVLHLLGQGDKTVEEAAEMRHREEKALRLLETIK